ncbi:MAG: DUF3568 domain-containing protein [Sulfuritalea sp.]|jgi:hypothetical protein|nr:DUF3568 domain-containing protein [Sulfuritalea sp.]
MKTMRRMQQTNGIKLLRIVTICGTVLLLGGCEAMAITAFGVGASTGVAQTLNGRAYRTFTAPVAEVKHATLAALGRMGMKVISSKRVANEEIITARATDREIEINLEILSPNSTRMRSVTKQGMFYDSATSLEIVLQTEKRMING